jgi:hypothetical protein
LKYSPSLCAPCNNDRTQPHDRAWERLSEYLHGRNPPIRAGMEIRLDTAFPGSVRRSMLNVHLFFVKQFGCLIAEESIPLDIRRFARAVINGEAHPNVWLCFWASSDTRLAGRSPVQSPPSRGKVEFVTWFYHVGRVAVNVMYAEPNQRRRELTHAWHPSKVGKHVRIAHET